MEIQASVIRAVRSPLALLALVAIIVGSIVSVSEGEQRTTAILVAALILTIVLVVLYGLEQLKATAASIGGSARVERVATRAELYRRAARLIATSHEIRDATWAPYAGKLAQDEEAARNEYRQELERALQANKHYFELFDRDEERPELIEDARDMTAKYESRYRARCVDAGPGLGLLDFMVADSKHVLLSHVSTSDADILPSFVYIESNEVGQLFEQFFGECWKRASDIGDLPELAAQQGVAADQQQLV